MPGRVVGAARGGVSLGAGGAPARGIYLDWNATAPLAPEVAVAMQEAMTLAWGNPSSVHGAGRVARALVEETRESVATLLGAEPRDVLFTSGATEANNLALQAAPALVTSRLEHPSVTRVAEALAERGRPVTWLPVTASGLIEPQALDTALQAAPRGEPRAVVVAVAAVNHETGVIQDIPGLSVVSRRHGASLHVDIAQALGRVPRSAWAGADTLAFSAHKVRGPKGVGAFVSLTGRSPEPVLLGGAQERGLRPGTLDPVALAGLGAAVRRAEAGPERYAAVAGLRDELEAALLAHVQVNGTGVPRAPHVSNLSVPGWSGDELAAALDLAGVYVSSGSACSAGTAQPPAAVLAMLGSERARSAIRVSLGEVTLHSEVQQAIAVFKQVLGACR